MEAVDVELGHGVLTGLRRHEIDFLLRALHELLDRGGVDAAVLHEPVERHARDLAAHGIEGRDEHHLRRFVDEQRDARRGLEGFDVATLAADDAALHLLARELDDGRGEIVVGLARDALHRGDEDAARVVLQLLLGFLERGAAQGAQLVLAFKQHLVAERGADLVGVELGDALEALADVLREIADGVARGLDSGALAVEALLPLLKLVIEEREGLLVRADLAEADIALDLAAVELAIELGALLLDFGLGLLLLLLGRDRRLAPRDLDQFRRLLVRDAARLACKRPRNEEAHAAADHDKGRRQRPFGGRVAVGEQQRGKDGAG